MYRFSKFVFALSVLAIMVFVPMAAASAAPGLQEVQPPVFDWSRISAALMDLLLATLPVLAGFAARWLNAKYKTEVAKLTSEQRYALELVAKMAVMASQQVYKDNAQKKRAALATVNAYLAQHNLTVDVAVVDAAIESAVFAEIKNPAPALTAIPAG